MAIPAGSKGGYIGTPVSLGVQISELPSALHQIWQQYQMWQVTTLGLYVNSFCNLACAHCYYQTPNGYRSQNTVDLESLNASICAARATNVRLFAFVGKEILMRGDQGASKTIAAMQFLSKRRLEGWPIYMGGITNGFFLDEVITDLKAVGLSFLDISFDGHDASTHDRVRGAGSFERSSRNLRIALENNVAEKIFIATTLYSGNLKSLSNILKFHREFGARHFSVMPIVAVQRAEQAISLDELIWFLGEDLPSGAAKLTTQDRIELVVDLDSYMICRRLEQFEALFAGGSIEIDALHNLLVRRKVGVIDLVMRLSLPDPCNGYGCLTHDGLYFDKGGCLFMKRGYEQLGARNDPVESLADHIQHHERRAFQIEQTHQTTLFQKSATALLNEVEGTPFYAIPETV